MKMARLVSFVFGAAVATAQRSIFNLDAGFKYAAGELAIVLLNMVEVTHSESDTLCQVRLRGAFGCLRLCKRIALMLWMRQCSRLIN